MKYVIEINGLHLTYFSCKYIFDFSVSANSCTCSERQ